MSNYGQRIAELRKKFSMTQQELGEKLNISSQAVSKWENGLSEPDLETIKKMCSLFNVSPNDFFSEKPLDEVINSEEKPSEQATPKIINGYCERCKKPVSAGEYEVTHKTHTHGYHHHQSHTTEQHIYCLDCYKIICEEEKIKSENQARIRRESRINTKKKEMRKGLLWGFIIAILILAIGLYIANGQGYGTIYYVVLGAITYGILAVISQLFWGDSYLVYILAFFSKTFKMPGVIFSLSLDGIISLIFVKIMFGLLSSILSGLIFGLGFCIAMVAGLFTFPFALAKEIKETK